MSRILSVLLGLALAAFFPIAQAQAPQVPEIAARSFLLIDVTANQVLAGQDIDTPVEPASLTKLMSAYLVFDAVRAGKLALQQPLPVFLEGWDYGLNGLGVQFY